MGLASALAVGFSTIATDSFSWKALKLAAAERATASTSLSWAPPQSPWSARISSVIINLREAEVELGRGMKVPEVCKKLGIDEYTYYRWRKEYGGLRLNQARRLKELERENVRLKKLVADLSLDNAILREAAQGNSSAR